MKFTDVRHWTKVVLYFPKLAPLTVSSLFTKKLKFIFFKSINFSLIRE